MSGNFIQDYHSEMSETVYVCGNPFSESELEQANFQVLTEAWKGNWDHDSGTVRPEPLTDQAIHYSRSLNPNRLIVHYMQPHYPFLSNEIGEGITLSDFGQEDSMTPWTLLEQGQVTEEEVWMSYKDNLRVVLDDLRKLLNNVDADRVVISADHGNAMGEWGIYGHPYGWSLDSLKKVPWIETKAVNSGTYTPEIQDQDSVDANVNERLSALGYK
jgi:hypothetical protein